MADLGSDITRHFRIVFMELVDQSARVLHVCRRFLSQLSVSLPSDLYCNTGGFGGFVCIYEAKIAFTSYS